MKSSPVFVVAALVAMGSVASGPLARAQELDEPLSPASLEPEISTDRASFGLRMTVGEKWGRKGMIVLEVKEGSPAAKGDLAAGHLIATIDGRLMDFRNDLEFVRWMTRYKAGQTITVGVLQNAGAETVVQLTGRETTEEAVRALVRWVGIARARLGSGKKLYCESSTKPPRPKRSAFRTFMIYAKGELESSGEKEAQLVLKKTTDTLRFESNLRDAPLAGLSVMDDDFPESLRDLALQLLDGQRMIISVTLGAGSSYNLRVSEHPAYPDAG